MALPVAPLLLLLAFGLTSRSAAAVQAYLDAQNLQLAKVYLDGPSNLGPALGSRGLPSTLFYAADGRLHSAHTGVLNAAALASKLQDLQRR
ncbi:hypothetical protein [Roseateles sp.]|uniref:TlpA family protein disulfide reductase n=1 Tax=Roseateles sp. TaxID=1971397 RepID=UPI00286CD89D|nr:hypothetical protein [Roseateles sp.]